MFVLKFNFNIIAWTGTNITRRVLIDINIMRILELILRYFY